ncbi:MAG: LacI family transcriptional regulator [Lachnospiraceae bacterium]|nr:LacI family transcriptional regulator [Lachnospiraceae bacterium]
MSGIKDVAKRAGVSISTVSNVLNQSKYVSPELVKRVEDAVRDLSYEVDPIARSMKSKKSGTIGVIVEDMCGVFYPYVVKGINSVVMEKGYQLIICDTQGGYGDANATRRERELFKKLFASRVDGILFVTMVHQDLLERHFKEILNHSKQSKRVPLVSLERDLTGIGIDSVYFDAYNNAMMAVQHLVDCGCRKIGHITGPMMMQVAQERVLGYKDCILKNQLPADWSRQVAYGDYSHQSGYLAMKKLLENVPELDGVFCGNDQMAVGALKLLKECGKQVPEDIKVIGYDDVFLSSIIEPSLSTVHIQKTHTGMKAAQMLFQRIENSETDKKPVGVRMDSRLVIRKSTVKNREEEWIFVDW